MKIDVIIPVYNQERYLAAAINSVLGQCCLNKIYVIDAGSNDSSAQIAKSFAPTVELISSSKQINAAQARNLGVAQSSSELIAFLDADDLWKTDKLKKQIEALKQQGNNALIFSELEQFKSEELPEEVAAKLHIPEDTSRGYHVGTLLCHRKTFDSVGNFREDLSYSEFIEHRSPYCSRNFDAQKNTPNQYWNYKKRGSSTITWCPKKFSRAQEKE